MTPDKIVALCIILCIIQGFIYINKQVDNNGKDS